jgi:hypothetical protein
LPSLSSHELLDHGGHEIHPDVSRELENPSPAMSEVFEHPRSIPAPGCPCSVGDVEHCIVLLRRQLPPAERSMQALELGAEIAQVDPSGELVPDLGHRQTPNLRVGSDHPRLTRHLIHVPEHDLLVEDAAIGGRARCRLTLELAFDDAADVQPRVFQLSEERGTHVIADQAVGPVGGLEDRVLAEPMAALLVEPAEGPEQVTLELVELVRATIGVEPAGCEQAQNLTQSHALRVQPQ